MSTSKVIFYTRKDPVTTTYIPELKGYSCLISSAEVMKRTEKGYRLKERCASEKGSMYLDEHYHFFDSYTEALEFIAAEANKVAASLDEMKLKAVRLMVEAHDEIKAVANK